MRKFVEYDIPFGLGTDIAGGPTLSMFRVMEQTIYTQLMFRRYTWGAGPFYDMNSEAALYLATLGGATALGMQEEIGSLEVGKKADFLLLDMEQITTYNLRAGFDPMDKASLVQRIVFQGKESAISEVYVDGIKISK